MTAAGLIARVGHPTDGRSELLTATALGRRLYRRVRRDIVRENAEALAGLSPAERARFIAVLRRFTLAAQRRIRGAPPE
jgi:DNA-binding MarR family transcriptional regulator